MFHNIDDNTKEIFIHQVSKRAISIYWLLLIGIVSSLLLLPFLHTDVSVKAAGIIRPVQERTELKANMPGIIDSMYVQEGQAVSKDAIILKLRDQVTGSKRTQLAYEIGQHRRFINDLLLLTSQQQITNPLYHQLQSPLYKQQISRFLYQQAEQQALIRKARKEWHIDSSLAVDKVIALKELFDKEVENEKLQAAFHAFKQEQLSIWQQDLVRYRLELTQFVAQQEQVEKESLLYSIKAPVSGTVQGIAGLYAGGFVQAGETVGMVSPTATPIVECYVSTRDVGLIKTGQEVKLQIDAFDYNYFGIVTACVSSIDADFTLIENKPVFKVRCALNEEQVHLRNGFTGTLKKGMTVQARFVVARRSLWQLLFDKVDDWLNPSRA